MKRLIIILFIVTVTIFYVAAGSQPAGDDSPPAPKTLRLGWWTNEVRTKITKDIVDLYMSLNPDINIDRLSVGQEITIPAQDLLTPFIPMARKQIVIDLAEQNMRIYENGALLYEWMVSTGLKDSPSHRGVFQVVSKEEKAYGSQWDLWMPYFIGIYPAGGTVYNGIHELPILANGQRLWAGTLGRPASFGCVILGIPEAETLFNWAEIGVLVVIE